MLYYGHASCLMRCVCFWVRFFQVRSVSIFQMRSVSIFQTHHANSSQTHSASHWNEIPSNKHTIHDTPLPDRTVSAGSSSSFPALWHDTACRASSSPPQSPSSLPIIVLPAPSRRERGHKQWPSSVRTTPGIRCTSWAPFALPFQGRGIGLPFRFSAI